MLFYPSYCGDGVILGINLFINSLLPAILPFIIFSNILIKSNISKELGRIFYPLTHKLFNVSAEGSYAVIMGFLCGYPVGAKIINDLYFADKITKYEANYLFRFINHASPAFIQGYIVFSLLNSPHYRILAITLTYLPEIIIGLIYRNSTGYISSSDTDIEKKYPLSKILDDSIFDALLTTIKIGGYLILFSIAATLINHITFLSLSIKTLIISFFEITSGSYYISHLKFNSIYKLFFCIIICISGGLSTFFQINSVTRNSNLNIKIYIISKIQSIIICTLLFLLYIGIKIYINVL